MDVRTNEKRRVGIEASYQLLVLCFFTVVPRYPLHSNLNAVTLVKGGGTNVVFFPVEAPGIPFSKAQHRDPMLLSSTAPVQLDAVLRRMGFTGNTTRDRECKEPSSVEPIIIVVVIII